ncbi:MAG TPA: hypothetical protein VFF56_03680 [Bacillota bacterium]|jgi:hypothetical protein|nr:hypothetical protein [Bacillota bacterium]
MKTKGTVIIIILVAFIAGGIISYCVFNTGSGKLPKPVVGEGIYGEMFGVDKNINEETIDDYLNREDTVYRDMRMLIDDAVYENIGGDSYLSGFVKGFEAVPFPLIVNVTELPPEVGEAYGGETLFTQNGDGEYIANYDESLEFLEYYFPKDKNIFLMCGGAGYAGMMKSMLTDLGWDEGKIYNVGGYWFYDGENKVTVKSANGDDSYDFWKVTYHNIDFDSLNRIEDET